MTPSNFLERFRGLFEDTDPECIELTTEYKDLDEWSSLISFSIIAMVKMEFDKSVTGAEIRHCNTVEDLFNTIVAK